MSNGVQHRQYVSTLAHLTLLQAAAASLDICKTLGNTTRLRSAGDVGALALRWIGVELDIHGAAFIKTDSLLARMTGLSQYAQRLEQQVTGPWLGYGPAVDNPNPHSSPGRWPRLA